MVVKFSFVDFRESEGVKECSRAAAYSGAVLAEGGCWQDVQTSHMCIHLPECPCVVRGTCVQASVTAVAQAKGENTSHAYCTLMVAEP